MAGINMDIMEKLQETSDHLTKFIELLSEWQTVNDAQRARLDAMGQELKKTMEKIQNTARICLLQDKSSQAKKPSDVIKFTSPIPNKVADAVFPLIQMPSTSNSASPIPLFSMPSRLNSASSSSSTSPLHTIPDFPMPRRLNSASTSNSTSLIPMFTIPSTSKQQNGNMQMKKTNKNRKLHLSSDSQKFAKKKSNEISGVVHIKKEIGVDSIGLPKPKPMKSVNSSSFAMSQFNLPQLIIPPANIKKEVCKIFFSRLNLFNRNNVFVVVVVGGPDRKLLQNIKRKAETTVVNSTPKMSRTTRSQSKCTQTTISSNNGMPSLLLTLNYYLAVFFFDIHSRIHWIISKQSG